MGETWQSCDLLREFEAIQSSSPSAEAAAVCEDLPGAWSPAVCQVEGATLEDTPQLQVSTFEGLFGELSGELPALLQDNARRSSFWSSQPSMLQKYVIAAGLARRDVQCHAPAGCGQVFSCLIPMLANMMRKQDVGMGALAAFQGQCLPDTVILCPTSEVAWQVFQASSFLLKGSDFRCVSLQGSMREQIAQLARGADVLVATPERLLLFVPDGIVGFKQTFGLVMLDMGCMIDMGMGGAIQEMVTQHSMPGQDDRMSMMFMHCASIQGLDQWRRTLLYRPIVMRVTDRACPRRIVHRMHAVERTQKVEQLVAEVNQWLQSRLRLIIFAHSRVQAKALDERLWQEHIATAVLHGSLEEQQRHRTWRRFMQGQILVLVTTDAGIRGLDISSITCIVNYDLPLKAEAFNQRVGKTRISHEATITTYITQEEGYFIDDIQVLSAFQGILMADGAAVPDWLAQGIRLVKEGKSGRALLTNGWRNGWEEGIGRQQDWRQSNGNWQQGDWQSSWQQDGWQRECNWQHDWPQDGWPQNSWLPDGRQQNGRQQNGNWQQNGQRIWQ
ncbi:unnamed protein product [Effrenium voratum]|nr:unnamed protein product [Effrenium voratum]